jgi:hypothetical protein
MADKKKGKAHGLGFHAPAHCQTCAGVLQSEKKLERVGTVKEQETKE